MKFINAKSALAAAFFILLAPLAQAGGVDGGGNGVFISSPKSERLVFWDLYVYAPDFNDSHPGDVISFRGRSDRPTANQGETIDYREFKSFQFLKIRLAKWSKRAKNLVSLIKTGDFVGAHGADAYRMLFVGTPLYVQGLNEISVPDSMPTEGITAIPGATYNEKSAEVFVTKRWWDQAGLVSQAAMLLHERLRSIQIYYMLPNSELQKLVAMIMLRDPAKVSRSEFDDRAYSRSALAARPSPAGGWTQIGHTMSLAFTTRHMDAIFGCLKLTEAGARACLKRHFDSLPKSPESVPFPDDAPLWVYVNDDFYVDRAVQAKILGLEAGTFKLVSTGKRNQPSPPPSPDATFTQMYGVYKIVKCKGHTDLTEPQNQYCGYKELLIAPVGDDLAQTGLQVTGLLSKDGKRVTTYGFNYTSKKDHGAIYTEDGDKMASYKSGGSNYGYVYTMTHHGSSYVFTAKAYAKRGRGNFHFTYILEKQ